MMNEIISKLSILFCYLIIYYIDHKTIHNDEQAEHGFGSKFELVSSPVVTIIFYLILWLFLWLPGLYASHRKVSNEI